MPEPAGRRIAPLLIGKLEALVLLLTGGAVLSFAVAGPYELLMNPRFRWLSIAGAVLLLALGLALAWSRQRGSILGAGAFLLMILIVVVGRPYVATSKSRLNLLPGLDIELPEQVDASRFTRTRLQGLFTAKLPPEYDVVTMGVVKRLPATDQMGGFLLMDSLMVCCAADMFGIGYFVPVDRVDEYQDGELLIVCGRLERSDSPIELDNFRFGNAVMSVVDEGHRLKPEMIFPYDRMAAMPTLVELMDSDKLNVFREAMRKTDLWTTLEGGGEWTIFAPVNEAFEKGGGDSWLEQHPDRMRSLLARHVVPERLLSKDLYDREELTAIDGTTIGVQVVNGKLIIGGARVLLQDKQARNGVLHYVYPQITAVDALSQP